MLPAAPPIVEKDLDPPPTFFQSKATCWTGRRTTDPIERLSKESKRRAQAMEVAADEISTCRCLVYAAQTVEYR